MKKYSFLLCLIFMISFSFSFKVSAQDLLFPIHSMEETENEGMFELESDSELPRVVLDCQSFFHGLNFYTEDESGRENRDGFYLLYEQECIEIFVFIEDNLEKGNDLCLQTKNNYEEVLLHESSCTDL